VRNEEVLRRGRGHRNVINTIKRKKSDWIGHILHRNCLLKHAVEGKIEGRMEVTGRRGRRCKQLLDDFIKTRRWWKLKRKLYNAEVAVEEAVDLS
jgi:hypothetical protein